AFLRRTDTQAYAAALGELERVRQEILQHLQQALRISVDGAAERRPELGREREAAGFRFMPERALHRPLETCKLDLFALDRYGAGLDLRQVQDVADEVQEIGAGCAYRGGELHLAC